MLLFVYGDDGVHVAEKLKQLRMHYLTKIDPSGTNLSEFPSPGSSTFAFPDVLQAVQSAPFLAEKRMVVVKGLLDMKKADVKPWIEGLSRTPTSTIVVLVDEISQKDAEKHALFVALKTQAEVHHYAQVKREGAALEAWVVEQAKEAGANMDRALASVLIARVGDDVWRLRNEVQKLASYGSPITKETIGLLVSREVDGNIFAFVDAVCRRETSRALERLEDERLAGSADLYVLAMLARHIRLLLQIRTALDEGGGGERQLGMHPYVLQKTLPQAKMTSVSVLSRWHRLLAQLDRDAKRGAIDPRLAVDRVVAELLLT